MWLAHEGDLTCLPQHRLLDGWLCSLVIKDTFSWWFTSILQPGHARHLFLLQCNDFWVPTSPRQHPDKKDLESNPIALWIEPNWLWVQGWASEMFLESGHCDFIAGRLANSMFILAYEVKNLTIIGGNLLLQCGRSTNVSLQDCLCELSMSIIIAALDMGGFTQPLCF